MDSLFQKFYKGFYLNTGGFIPSKPLNQNVYPGDFFQIRNGEMVILGNVFRRSVVSMDVCELSAGIALNQSQWDFNDGVTKPYAGRETANYELENEFKYSKQILAFREAGSYYFRAKDPESVKIVNWQEIQQELIIKLTQTFFSFREVYVVTECATTSSWTLAIASDEAAELEIATKEENFGLVDIFGSENVETVWSKNIQYFDRQEGRSPRFFKAKKLVVQQEKLEVFVNDLIGQWSQQETWANDFFDYDFFKGTQSHRPNYNGNMETSVLDMLQANQLNPNTALLYFKWEDANLDDVYKLFVSYGNS